MRLNSELAIPFNLRMKRGVPLNSTSLGLILPSMQLDMEISEPIQCPYCGQSLGFGGGYEHSKAAVYCRLRGGAVVPWKSLPNANRGRQVAVFR